jgi:type IV pilus assembly protein PilN
MYNLDINFLKDRREYANAAAGASRAAAWRDSGTGLGGNPILIGALVGLLPLALVLLGWGGLSLIKMSAEREREEVRSQVAALEQKEKERDQAQDQLRQAQAQIASLTGVFSNIKPWSAMSQDLRDRLPPGVQITEILQKTEEPKAAATAPAAAATPGSPSPAAAGNASPAAATAPAPIGSIEISGYADNFDRVNDFLVVLQKSNFLTPAATRIVQAERMQAAQLAPVSLPGPNGQAASGPQVQSQNLPKLPPKVSFKIETELAQVSTEELLRELDRKGAVGLVSRIEALKEKGVIKP